MVEVDGVGVDYVGGGCCSRIDILVELAGVEGGVIVTADGEGDGVGGSRLKSKSSAHQVHRQRFLGVLVEVESAPTGACSVCSAASAPPEGSASIRVIVAVVSGRHFVAVEGVESNGLNSCPLFLRISLMVSS